MTIILYQIWVAAVDLDLTLDGLISPGLGDTVSPFVVIISGISEIYFAGGSSLQYHTNVNDIRLQLCIMSVLDRSNVISILSGVH